MMDIDHLARIFASASYHVTTMQRLVIQPHKSLHGFRTKDHGFLFTIRGSATMHLNETVYDLESGSVLHAAPGLRLDSRITSTSEYEYFTVFYQFDESQTAPPEECDQHFKLNAGVHPRVPELLMEMHQLADSRGGLEQLRMKELFLTLLHHTFLTTKQRSMTSHPDVTMVEQAIAYIKSHYMNAMTLEGLAELHAVSPKRFSYLFHKHTGVRPIDYTIQYRMEKAMELLQTGHFPIHDVAFSVGYPNPLYFSRVFKNKVGLSPSAYMEQFSDHDQLCAENDPS